MEGPLRTNRTRGTAINDGVKRPLSRNKHWAAGEGGARSGSSTPVHEGERWERGGHRGGRGTRGLTRGSARKFPNASLRVVQPPPGGHSDNHSEQEGEDTEEEEQHTVEDPDPDTPEDREKFYQELVKAREIERKKAIAEGKMDDPLIPKRLEDAISMVGTCMDMCPRFERYRRERENNLFEWETIPGTKRVDHQRAVKMYERAAGDKTQPSDLRPPLVLKRTLDYLFHDLLPRGGFSQTFNFIRDRSRAVRNDFTMQHNTGPLAIECHDRCARFHILALHFERDRKGFSIALEEQQLMNTLQSLKEFYEDQRGRYESPTELEMRVYHRLIHIRDQKERHEDIPEHITSHPVFKLTTDFRIHVQKKSAPISKISALVVDAEGMQIFAELAGVLREQGSVVMIYLVACILERLFGKEAIDDIEAIRGDLSIPDVIDGISATDDVGGMANGYSDDLDDDMLDQLEEDHSGATAVSNLAPAPLKPSATEWLSTTFGPTPTTSTFDPPKATSSSTQPVSAFSTLATTPNVFNTPSIFGKSAFPSSAPTSVFGANNPAKSPFGRSETSTPATAAGPSTSSSFALPTAPNPFASPSANPLAPALVVPNAFAPAAKSFAPGPSNPFSATGGPISTFGSTSYLSGASASSGIPPTIPVLPEKTVINGSLNGALTNDTNPPVSSSINPSLNPRAPTFMPTSSATPTQPFPIFSEEPKPGGVSSVATSVPHPQNTKIFSPQTPTPSIFPPSKPANPPDTQKATPSPPPSSWTFSRSSTSTTPPILPKINTNTNPTSARPNQGFFNPSPSLPPPLNKKLPISLPSTPTITTPSANPLLGALKSNLRSSFSNSSSEILSPLYFPSPTTSRPSSVHNFSPSGTPKLQEERPSPEHLPTHINGHSLFKGKGKEIPAETEALSAADLEAKAVAFSQRCVLVKECFHRWQKRATDRAAWVEACRQSDAYQQKVQSQRLSHRPTPDKKRRISSGIGVSLESPQKKRARKRVSSEYQPPRSDEELARRFKENHEEHERRWAQGSFLQVLRVHVGTKAKAQSTQHPPGWRIWLSMNSEIDATAIWLERKFDVPTSGRWESETVFSIPLSHGEPPSTPGHPGVIIFECTPLQGVTDELERKYRILDDCSRLRDIIKALSPKRQFIPSLLVFVWADGDQSAPASDILDMIKDFTKKSVIESYHNFSLTSATKDLDRRFGEALDALTLDVEGKLVQSLTLRGVLKPFKSVLDMFVSEWIENCSASGEFDWTLYSRVVQASVSLLNDAVQLALGLVEADTNFDPLPTFDIRYVMDAESIYDAATTWLADETLPGAAHTIATDLRSHRDIGRDFPSRTFVDRLQDLAEHQLEAHIGANSGTTFYLLRANMVSTLEHFKRNVQAHAAKLTPILNLNARRSPRRRSLSEASEITRSSPCPKRMRLSESIDLNPGDRSPSPSPQINGRSSPSPSNSTVSLAQTDSSLITVAMLRALTRDMKQKYGQNL